MNLVLLVTELSGDSEVSFRLTDLWFIIGGLAAGITGWLKMIHNNKTTNDKIEGLEKKMSASEEEYKAQILYAKNGRKAIKRELQDLIKETSKDMSDDVKEKTDNIDQAYKAKDEIIHKRINKTQDDMKSYIEKTDFEFKEINKSIASIAKDTGEVKGMLQILISKKDN